MSIQDFGWHPFFQAHFLEHSGNDSFPARVTTELRDSFRIHSDAGDLVAELSGKLRASATSREDLPTVGDWVVATSRDGRTFVEAVLPRRSRLIRKAAGTKVSDQVIATNLDHVLLVMALNNDFNLRRVERYLTAIWDSGASPVVILSKSDLSPDPARAVSEVEGVALGTPVHAISARDQTGLEVLSEYTKPGITVALIGSSGAGKSTLANRLIGGDVQTTQVVRCSDDRGLHTTTRRDLFRLPGGGLLVDTPGMRTLMLWGVEGGLEATFPDVEEAGADCRFRDCTHQAEPGCGVQQAVANGSLSAERLASYFKLRREAARAEREVDAVAKRAEVDRWKRLTRAGRARGRAKRS